MEDIPLGLYRKIPLTDPTVGNVYAWTEACYKEQINSAGTQVGKYYTSIKDLTATQYWRDVAVPSGVTVKDVLKQILTAGGVLSAEWSSVGADIDDSILLQTKKKSKRDNFEMKIVVNGNFPARRYTYEGDDTVEYARLINDEPRQYQVDEPFPNGVDDPTVYKELRDYYIPVDGWYRISGPMTYSTGYEGANFLLMDRDVPLYSGLGGSERIIKTDEPDLSDVLWLHYPADYTGIFRHWYYSGDEGGDTFNERIYLKKGRYGLWVIAPGSPTTLPYPGDLGSFDITLDLTVTRDEGDSIDIEDGQVCYLDYNFMFTDLTAADVFKAILQAFGQYAEWSVASDNLQIFGFNDIVANKVNAYDWSDKILASRPKSLKYTLGLPDRILIAWAAEEQYKGLKDLYDTILSNQKGTAEYCVNPIFSGCDGMITETGGGTLTYPLVITNHIGRDNDLSIRKLAAYDSHVKMVKVVGRLARGVKKVIHHLYSQGGDTIIEDTFAIDQSIFVECDDSFFNYNDTTNGVGKYFKDLLAALNRITYIELPIYLQPKDVAELSFQKPVYLKQFGAYFSIEKIKYIQGGTSYIELLKINS